MPRREPVRRRARRTLSLWPRRPFRMSCLGKVLSSPPSSPWPTLLRVSDMPCESSSGGSNFVSVRSRSWLRGKDCGGFAKSAVAREVARTFMSFRSGPFPPFKAFLMVFPKSSAIAAFSVGSVFSISSSAFMARPTGISESLPDTACQGRGVSRASLWVARRVATGARSTSRRAVRESVFPPTRARSVVRRTRLLSGAFIRQPSPFSKHKKSRLSQSGAFPTLQT